MLSSAEKDFVAGAAVSDVARRQYKFKILKKIQELGEELKGLMSLDNEDINAALYGIRDILLSKQLKKEEFGFFLFPEHYKHKNGFFSQRLYETTKDAVLSMLNFYRHDIDWQSNNLKLQQEKFHRQFDFLLY